MTIEHDWFFQLETMAVENDSLMIFQFLDIIFACELQ